MCKIEIRYKTGKVEKLCTDSKKAKKELPAIVATKLYALIDFIKSSDDLRDIAAMPQYHIHPLKGDREGQFALDIAGRKSGYRLIITPLDSEGNEFTEKDVNIIYKSTKIIVTWEVSNHYE